MVPRKGTRRTLSKAMTAAVVRALAIYAPHAIGFVLIAVPVVVVAALAHWLLGTPTAIGAPLGVLGLAANGTMLIWRGRGPHENPPGGTN